MCLLLFYINPFAKENEYYLILTNVRDEIYTRPTKVAHFWKQNQNIIGGVDAELGKEGGTWLAMNQNGKIGALLNILQPDEEVLPNKKGRGFLAVDYVAGQSDCFSYLHAINQEKQNYNGFLLVTMDIRSLHDPKIAYVTNASSTPPVRLNPGFHAFGNSVTPETPWPKVMKAKEKFTEIVQRHLSLKTKDALVEDIFTLLRDSTSYLLDENMKKQGKSKPSEFLDKLSAIFVNIPSSNYGSRCHTVIIVDGSGKVDYFEHSRAEVPSSDGDATWTTKKYSYELVCDK
ncbi:transport and Golgi organization 2 homolog [Uloborus diversus]|uniref:transport and Golgi organization 2 homolog n=1 Tax=Uloborus diversus TaxID=327109 RepID=UPI00240950E7|nr:transport and Golgi organization 2 homolog [Uloborus diversus]